MAYAKFETYCLEEGFCCPYNLLLQRKEWEGRYIAEDAQVTERAVRYWRKLFRDGKLRCDCRRVNVPRLMALGRSL